MSQSMEELIGEREKAAARQRGGFYEKSPGLSATATEKTMVLNPWTGKTMSVKEFQIYSGRRSKLIERGVSKTAVDSCLKSNQPPTILTDKARWHNAERPQSTIDAMEEEFGWSEKIPAAQEGDKRRWHNIDRADATIRAMEEEFSAPAQPTPQQDNPSRLRLVEDGQTHEIPMMPEMHVMRSVN